MAASATLSLDLILLSLTPLTIFINRAVSMIYSANERIVSISSSVMFITGLWFLINGNLMALSSCIDWPGYAESPSFQNFRRQGLNGICFCSRRRHAPILHLVVRTVNG